LQQTEHGTFLSLDPHIAQQMMNKVAASLEKLSALDYPPVLMCSSQIRQHVKRLVDRFMPRVTVLSYDEILSNVEIQSLDVLELNDAD
jgi:flagellar biosynthesis protein FlhA